MTLRPALFGADPGLAVLSGGTVAVVFDFCEITDGVEFFGMLAAAGRAGDGSRPGDEVATLLGRCGATAATTVNVLSKAESDAAWCGVPGVVVGSDGTGVFGGDRVTEIKQRYCLCIEASIQESTYV